MKQARELFQIPIMDWKEKLGEPNDKEEIEKWLNVRLEEEMTKKKNQSLEMKNISSTIIKGEKELLERLFSNILENAIKYTPEKGKIIIEMKRERDEVEVAISDNGIGIKKENRRKIFDRFYRIEEARTTESRSSGLGLAISQKIAKIHQAEIKVKSEYGKGSCFTVDFLSKD